MRHNDRLRRIERTVNDMIMGQTRRPGVIIEGPTRCVLIWSNGQAESISESQAEDLRHSGQVGMTITTTSDKGVDLTAEICSGAGTE